MAHKSSSVILAMDRAIHNIYRLRRLHKCAANVTRGSSRKKIIPQTRSSSSKSSSPIPKKILSLSSLLLQDGLAIQEVPMVVRRTDRTMFPYTNDMICSQEVLRKASESDENFKQMLHQSTTVKEVFKQLQIPAEQVTGHTAAYALLRMCQLKKVNYDWDDLDTFVCTAVMNELYDTLSKDISSVSNDMLTSLITCFFPSAPLRGPCVDSIHEEIEIRIGDVQFSIQELCALSRILCQSTNVNKMLINHLWIHIGSRYSEIDETNIVDMFSSLPKSHKYIVKLVGVKLNGIFMKLNGDDIAKIVESLVRLNLADYALLNTVVKWLYLHLHNVSEANLMQVLSTFVHFNFLDKLFVVVLERFICAGATKIDTNLLAICMEYLRGRRYFSPKILDAAAKHFCKHCSTYNNLQVFAILRPFGQLNYLPADSTVFLTKVEDILNAKLNKMDASHFMEILCSFAFVEKIPVNFVPKVLSLSYFSRLKAVADTPLYARSHRWVQIFQSVIALERKDIELPFILKLYVNQPTAARSYRDGYARVELQIFDSLKSILGSHVVQRYQVVRKVIDPIDFELATDECGNVLPYGATEEHRKRFALVIRMPDHYCVNCDHLLGEYVMTNRHLELSGYQVIQLVFKELVYVSASGRKEYLRKSLSPHIKLPFN